MKRILCLLVAGCIAGLAARIQGQCVPPSIVSQPADLTVSGCCPCAGFAVGVAGTAPFSYQWEKNGLAISGATNPTYTNCNITAADNGARYRVVVFNACGLVSSQFATLTVTPDVTPPRLLSATAGCPTNKLTLVFDECLDPSTAEDVAHYLIQDGAGSTLQIDSAMLQADKRTVCLFVNPPFTASGSYTVTVINMSDQCDNHADMLTLDFQVVCDDCLAITQQTLNCVPGAPGQYTWNFTLKNLSTNAVKYIYLIPETNCFTLTPPVTTLPTPLGAGQSTMLTATLNVATNCGTNLCVRIATHDPQFVLCCSEVHCLDLPSLVPRPRLQIMRVPPNLVITWNGCGVLQCTTALGTPWMDVPGASSPYTVPPGEKKFYRVRL